MKKCPKCKAEIQENARFCLYCMTSFEEKQPIESPKIDNKRWLNITAGLLLVFIVCAFFILIKKDNSNISSKGIYSSSQNSSEKDFIASDYNNTTSNQQSQNIKPKDEAALSSNKNDQSQNNTNSKNNTNFDNIPITSTNNSTTNNTSSESPLGNNTTDGENSDDNPSSATSLPETASVTYSYRDAKYGDDFSVSANLDDCVVITGVITASSNGKYDIPETLGGKKVIAIMGSAFCDESISNTVKTVIVPSTVKTIWNDAFANCYNLTDIYFCGSSIYTEAEAFPEKLKRNGTLTIHCSAICNDRNLRYYKNSSSNYDAEYIEWNG